MPMVIASSGMPCDACKVIDDLAMSRRRSGELAPVLMIFNHGDGAGLAAFTTVHQFLRPGSGLSSGGAVQALAVISGGSAGHRPLHATRGSRMSDSRALEYLFSLRTRRHRCWRPRASGGSESDRR
jgi:hypothetical protein